MASSFFSVMPAITTITEYLRTADESGRAMVISILQQTIDSPNGEAEPTSLRIRAPSMASGATRAKTPRVLSEETKTAKTAFMAGLVAEVKAVQTELGSTYKEAQTEVAIRKIMREEGKSHEDAQRVYEEKMAEKQWKAMERKEAKASGLPTPRAKTPKKTLGGGRRKTRKTKSRSHKK